MTESDTQDKNWALHYKVLKQFLDILDDASNRTKLTSSRALRAKEKLLKLSMAQFTELSTDVYDELKRRIDESRLEPLYLLPRSTFHPKRNQARQKLSSLPQTRFKDLVSDISYEIERRNLSAPARLSSSLGKTDSTLADLRETNTSRDTFQGSHPMVPESPIIPSGGRFSPNVPGLDVPHATTASSGEDSPQQRGGGFPVDLDNKQTTIGAQSTTVVPTKANMAWSSDEEEPNNDYKQPPLSLRNYSPRSHGSDPVLSPMSPIDANADAQNNETNDYPHGHAKSEAAVSESVPTHDSVSIAEFTEEIAKLKAQLDEVNRERDILLTQLADASKVHQDKLNLETDLISSKSEILDLRLEVLALKKTLEEAPSASETSGVSPVQTPSVKAELESLVDKLFTPEDVTAEPFATSAAYYNLKTEVEKWQSMYQAARSDSIVTAISTAAMGQTELASYVSPHGLLSIRMVADMHALIESFIAYLNEPTYDVDILFDLVSRVAILANQLALQGEAANNSASEYAVCLRESVSYALTATRYQATFSQAFPKIVLERAVGELTFALCDFVALAKLVEGSDNDRAPETTPLAQERPAEPTYDFGARPLRMANRLRANKNSPATTPTEEKNAPLGGVSSGADISAPTKPKQSVSFLSPPPHDESAPDDESSLASEKKESGAKDQESATYPERDSSLPQSASKPLMLSKIVSSLKEPAEESSSTPSMFDVSRKSLQGTSSSAQETSPGESGDDNEMLPSGVGNGEAQSLSASSNMLDATSTTTPVKNVAPEKSTEKTENQDISPPGATSAAALDAQNQVKSPSIPLHRPSPKSQPSPSQSKLAPDSGKQSKFPVSIKAPAAVTPKRNVSQVSSTKQGPSESDEDQNTSSDADERAVIEKKRDEARQRQEYRKSMAAATFNIQHFEIDNPDNTLTQVLLYLEHQTVQVISTIQSLLSAIKVPGVKCGDLRGKAHAITVVVTQMTGATNSSMNQTRNAELKQHGSWVVENLDDCSHRMARLCHDNEELSEDAYADKNFKQRLAGISFDIAKCTKELVKTVEEASIREDIANLDARLQQADDLT